MERFEQQPENPQEERKVSRLLSSYEDQLQLGKERCDVKIDFLSFGESLDVTVRVSGRDGTGGEIQPSIYHTTAVLNPQTGKFELQGEPVPARKMRKGEWQALEDQGVLARALNQYKRPRFLAKPPEPETPANLPRPETTPPPGSRRPKKKPDPYKWMDGRDNY